MNSERPIVIIGGGPTGLTLANLLANYGIAVLLVERNTSTVQEPRAVSIDDEALRTMQAAGVIDKVLPEIVMGYGSHYYSVAGKCFLRVQPQTVEYGYPRRNAFQQPVLEATLRDQLMAQANVKVWFGSEVLGFQQETDYVSVQVRQPNGSLTVVRCMYLIGCDGARSLARQTLGIKLVGSTFRERWLILDLDKTNDASRDTKVFCNPISPCISLPGPKGTRRFEFMLQNEESDEEALAPENVAYRLSLYSDDQACPIRRQTVYTFHARIAERWRDGRVFLAGDAAHLSPPFAGQGMNSGIRDAHNLAWKLAAVLNGHLGSALLDTYELERRDHAWQMILLAIRMGHVMMPRSRVGALALQTLFTALNNFKSIRDYFGEMKYKPKPYFREGFLVRQQDLDDPTHLVGKLFPQPTVAIGSSSQVWLDDVLGNGFSLLALPGTSPLLFEQVSATLCKSLQPKRVAMVAPGESWEGTHDDITLVSVDPKALPKALHKFHGLLLLRPDHYVAAVLPDSKIASANKQLDKLISST